MKIKQKPEDFVVNERIVLPELVDGGELTYFWLEKEGHTTEAAISAIARGVRANYRRFKFAGSKDKNAQTRQAVSAFKIRKEALEKVDVPGIKIEVIGQGRIPISLGSLEGNGFEIVVRDLSKSKVDQMGKKQKELIEKGMPNYFGEQRFGRGNTHLIGQAILKGDLEKAVKEILCFVTDSEFEDKMEWRKKAKRKWGNFQGLLEIMPIRGMRLDYWVVEWLAKYKNDFAGALRTLPKHLRKLYVQSYQSWLWNQALKENLDNAASCREHELSKKKCQDSSYNELPEELPLPGCETVLGKEKFDMCLKKLLKEDGLTLEDFKCKVIPELEVSGVLRQGFVKPEDFSIESIEEDELNPGRKKVKLKFYLPKGCYATVLIGELFG